MTASTFQISEHVFAELTATCDSLGYNDGKQFHLDKNSIEVIKDLIRFLRRDDESHAVRRFLGQSKLLQKDLIPIFIEHSNKEELWNVLLRLLINLTSPALMVYNEELPTEKITRSYYLQILSHLQDYKSAMANDAVWAVVNEKMKKILSIESAERGEEMETIMERILVLIRNILRVPASDSEKRTDNDTNVHDEVLFALHTSGVAELLVYMASTTVEQQYHMQILEIIAFMLQGQNPARLAKVEMHRTNLEKQQDEAKLLLIRQKEQAEKMAKLKKYAGSRHSKFGTTFVVQNMKAIGDHEMICHKPYQKIEDLDFSVTKQKVKKRKNKTEIVNLGEERVSALSVRLFLKEFCVEFLNGAYNPVMRHARMCIQGDAGISNDASHYLWALRFFMNFNRHYKFQVKYVSETIAAEVFYIVQRQIETNYEMMKQDKKKIPFFASRMHLGINAYQELLLTLIVMDGCNDAGVKNSSRIIMNNIFYVPEYRDTILSQLMCFNQLTMSIDYLVDLVTTAHIFLKMLKNFCEKERHVVVKKVKRKKPKKKTKPPAAPAPVVEPARSLEERWDEVGPEVSAVMQQNAIPDVRPFDATIDTPIDDQKGDAMKRIQKLLRCKDYEQAIGLLRSARNVWPENDSFGKADLPAEEEFLILREIFFADLGVPEDEPVQNSQTQKSSGNQIENLLNYEDEEEDDEEENEEIEEPQFEESSFNFMEFLYRFANVRIVANLTILFKQFEKNTPELNHYVLKMFHRIAFECKMPAMLHQASIFRVFQRIFRSDNAMHKELAQFARYIFRGFAEVAARNPKAYMELLFWKSTKQAVEMTDGYDTQHQQPNKKAQRNAWTEAEEDELRTLFMEHQTNKPAKDLIDYIQENLINQDRTRRGIIKKLKEMYLIVNSKGVRNEVQKRLPKEWSEEEIAQLTELWEQVKEEDDPVGLIHDSLRIKRSKPKIKEKLLELHLAEDPKQLRKKRTKKSDGPKSSWETRSASENESGTESDDDEDEDDDDDNGDVQTGSVSRKEKKKKKSRTEKKKSKQPSFVYTDAQLSGLLKDVIAKDMQEALQWLKESLEDSLEDRDEESEEGQALVPLTAETSAAIDSPSFQRFLRGAGIEPPNLEEAYWRIPATMLVNTIKKRIEIIDSALRGEFIEEAIITARKDEESDSDDDAFFERLKKYSNKDNNAEAGQTPSSYKSAAKKSTPVNDENSERPSSDKENDDSENENVTNDKAKGTQKSVDVSSDSEKEDTADSPMKSQNEENKTKSKRIKTVLDSSDSEEEQIKSQIENNKDKSNENATKNNLSSELGKSKKSKRTFDSDSEEEKMEIESLKKTDVPSESNLKVESAKSSRIRKVLDSDSEEESEKVLQNIDESSLDMKRIRSENSDTETPTQKKRRVLDSDEEDDNIMPEHEKSVEKKQARVLSDDDDD